MGRSQGWDEQHGGGLPAPRRQPAGPHTMGPVFPTFCVGRYLIKPGGAVGDVICEYQLEPVARALGMPRSNQLGAAARVHG